MMIGARINSLSKGFGDDMCKDQHCLSKGFGDDKCKDQQSL